MNIQRALVAGVLVYLLFLLVGGLLLLFNVNIFVSWGFAFLASLCLIGYLFIAKWYFKQDPPTAKKGLFLGLITLLVGGVFDGLCYLVMTSMNMDMSLFMALYTNWRMYFLLGLMVIVSSYAGYEFDATFTAVE